MKIRNLTSCRDAEAFLIKKMSNLSKALDISGLRIKIEFLRRRNYIAQCQYLKDPKYKREFTRGRYNIRIGIHPMDSLTIRMMCFRENGRSSFRSFIEGIHENKAIVIFLTNDELVVFLLGHELWHWICRETNQLDLDTEIEADSNGFDWLEEFRRTLNY